MPSEPNPWAQVSSLRAQLEASHEREKEVLRYVASLVRQAGGTAEIPPEDLLVDDWVLGMFDNKKTMGKTLTVKPISEVFTEDT